MKTKFYLVVLVMILILSLLTVNVSALSFTASMTASSSRVTSATEVTVTVKVSNLDVGDNGINLFSAYLSYDTTVFESLTDSSVDGLNGWIAAYAPGTGTPESFGLTNFETVTILTGIVATLNVTCMDLVEIAPPLDVNNITSRLGLKTLYEVFHTLIVNKKLK